jgi:hypothetical protein
MRFAVSLILSLALVACARTSEPDPNPAEDNGAYNKIDPVPSPAAGAAAEPPAAGEWREAQVRGRPALLFAGAGSDQAMAAIYCDERRGLVIERRGLVPAGEIDMMSLAAGDQRQRLAVAPVREDGGPVLRAALPFNAELIAVLQQGPTPLTIDVGEGARLSLPATPLLPQLVTRCRVNG